MIKQMRKQGAYIIDIATQVGCSERTVRRYLKYPEPPARKTRHKMAKLKPLMDYTQPGYQLQHDWGEVEVEVAGQRCKVNFAVNTLGLSASLNLHHCRSPLKRSVLTLV
jgi:transposase